MKLKVMLAKDVAENHPTLNFLPHRGSEQAAGWDLHAAEDAFVPHPRLDGKGCLVISRVKVRTGLHFEIPTGWFGLVPSRSGHAAKNGVHVLNSPGIIDSDYRGEVSIVLINLGTHDFEVKVGDRIAQMLIQQHADVEFEPVDSLGDTKRGAGGYGSTGK